jgi:hypothetical protein
LGDYWSTVKLRGDATSASRWLLASILDAQKADR